MQMKKTAIIIGATGLTGDELLKLLIKDPDFEKIKLFSRRKSGIKNPKVEEYLVDMFQLQKYQNDFKSDIVFCCVGTTKAKTPDRKTYKKIDHGIPVQAATLTKLNAISTFVVISAIGANSNSKVFYNRTKGEMECDVLKQNIQNVYILQPSLIYGNRKEKRIGEFLASGFMKVFNCLIPKKYKRISAKTIAFAMKKLAKNGYSKTIITSDEIKRIAKMKNHERN